MEEQNQEMKSLFGFISYTNDEQLELIIDNMEYQESFLFISKALEYAHNQGLFNLTESEVLSKSLRIFLKKNILGK